MSVSVVRDSAHDASLGSRFLLGQCPFLAAARCWRRPLRSLQMQFSGTLGTAVTKQRIHDGRGKRGEFGVRAAPLAFPAEPHRGPVGQGSDAGEDYRVRPTVTSCPPLPMWVPSVRLYPLVLCAPLSALCLYTYASGVRRPSAGVQRPVFRDLDPWLLDHPRAAAPFQHLDAPARHRS